MTDDFIELTEDEFDDRYTLKSNHLNSSAGWAIGDSGGCLFETYGEELSSVRQQDPCTVWTLTDGDDGDMYLISGYHFVNRIGYLLSTIPIPEDVTIQVHLPMSPTEDPDPDEQPA
jgi:hypothetical protein